MFTKRSNKDKPQERFDVFLATIWWPGDAGRVPSGVRKIVDHFPEQHIIFHHRSVLVPLKRINSATYAQFFR